MHAEGKKRYLWHLTIAIMVAAIGAVTFFWLSQSELLAIEEIQVEGNRLITTDEVLEKIGPLLKGQSLLSLSFDDASRLISQSPFAESVEVERDFPHVVRIRIREFSPLVNLKGAGNATVILSAESRALAQIPAPAPQLPVLMTRQPCAVEVGQAAPCPDVNEGVWFLANIPVSFNQQFAEVSIADGDITAKTRTGVSVHFGTLDDYVLKFEVLRQLLTRTGASGAGVTFDVSVPERPVTRDKAVTVATTATTTTPEPSAADQNQEQSAAATADAAAADTGAEAAATETAAGTETGDATGQAAGADATSPAQQQAGDEALPSP